YAVRLLLKRPGFTALTILVMAVGLGLSIYLFSFLNTMAYKPLPFKDGESLIVIDKSLNGLEYNGGNLEFYNYQVIREQLKGITEHSLYSDTSANVSGRDGARRYNATEADHNLFQMTRTKPILGRDFTVEDTKVGAEDVAVIGYDLWQNHFAGDPQVVNQTIRVDGKTTRVIGVMPEGYFFPRNAEIWLPMRISQEDMVQRNTGSGGGIVHLAPGTSLADINNQLTTIMKRLEQEYPKTNAGIGAHAASFPMSTMGGGSNIFLTSMYVVSVLLLLLASINVGNLLLSRAVERSKETAIRVALGAPRARLVGQMLWESTIICTVGGVVGLLVAAWALEVTESITATFTDDKPFFWWKFGIDSYTVSISLIFVISTILITGLLPAWKNSGADFNAVLRDGTRGALGKKAGRLNRVLVISEVFLSACVLIAACSMVVGTYIANKRDYGADIENVLTAKVRLIEANYNTREKRAQFAKRLHNELENNVGIGDVAIFSALPGEYTWSPTIAVEGTEYINENSYPRANYIVLTPGSLQKIGVQLRSGRYFDSSDDGLEKRTVIITDSFADKYFAGQDPVGKRIRVAEIDGDEPRWLTVVGVVEHTIQGQSFSPSSKTPSIFRSITQAPRFNMSIAMRMKADDAIVIRTLRKVLEQIDPDLPAHLIKTYEEKIARNTAGIGFASKVFLLFAIVALILASSGIYGVMTNTISQRTQEIGVKRALGAEDSHITREFIWAGVKQLLWGVIPGTLAGGSLGYALGLMMSTGTDVLGMVIVSVVTVIAIVVLTATFLPTKRVLMMEPSLALRYE
ncbi:MAG: ADOP family duplicated permease, partial [Kangiellaceae bacterium]|nr:ADOP family duplicated permease [Kangiellaceae bacterium]